MKKSILLWGMLALPLSFFAQTTETAATLATESSVMTPEKLWELGRVSLDAVSENGLVIFGVTHYDTDANKGNRDLFLGELNSGEISALRE